MDRRFLLCVVISAALCALMGCVSSEETGAGDRAKSPIHTSGTIDTSRHLAHHEVSPRMIAGGKIDSVKLVENKNSRLAPKFKTRQDTVRASVYTKSKQAVKIKAPIERTAHSYFTVQIGAFSKASNALRAQKRAKGRFSQHPVFNNFVRSAKIYRVSIGRFEAQQDAFALSESIRRKYPNDYHTCWINFIR